GVAAGAAADEVIEQGKKAAAARLEAAASDIEYRDGEFRIAGTDRKASLFELGALEATHTRTPPEYTYPNGCHICEVEIDPGAGEAGAVGAPAAVINAIVDALKGKPIDMPASAEAVWRALQSSTGRAGVSSRS